MTVAKATALRVTCDYSACGVPELLEGSDVGAKLPDGWYVLEIPGAERRTFNSEDCLLRFVRSLSVIEFDGNAERVGSVGSHLVWVEVPA